MLSVCHQAFCACDCQVSCAQDVVSSLFCLFVAMIGMLGGCLVCAVLCFVVFLFHFTSVMCWCAVEQLTSFHSPLCTLGLCFLLLQIWQLVHCFILLLLPPGLEVSSFWNFLLVSLICINCCVFWLTWTSCGHVTYGVLDHGFLKVGTWSKSVTAGILSWQS